jgi:hypothetical protein
VELPKVAVMIPESAEANSNETLCTVQEPLANVLERLCYDCLEEQHAGWEINGGSDGRFTFNVAERVVNLSISIKEYEYFEEAF